MRPNQRLYKSSHQSESQRAYSGTSELFDFEEGLARYNTDVVKKLTKTFAQQDNSGFNGRILELGAGTGALAEIWHFLFGVKPICIEIDPNLIKVLQSKGFEVAPNILEIEGKVNVIYASNVLEHIEDDVKVLGELKQKIQFGGKLAIYVPALPFLFSDLDRKVGHFRRYRKKELIEKVTSAGFEVQKCHYNDCMGILATFLVKFFGYRNKLKLGSKNSLIFYDTVLYPISMFFDRILFKNLIGKNILLIAVNPKA